MPPREPAVLAAVAVGGAVGATARWGLGSWTALTEALDPGWGGSAGAVLAINVFGSFLMGLLVCWLLRRPGHRLARPFLGSGILGGFTTFSTFAYDAHSLWSAGESLTAASYFILTPVLAILACWVGVRAMHRLLGGRLPAEADAGDLFGPTEEAGV